MEKVIIAIAIIVFIITAGVLVFAIVELLEPPHMRRAKKRRKEIERLRAAKRKKAAQAQKQQQQKIEDLLEKTDTSYRYIPPEENRKEKIIRPEPKPETKPKQEPEPVKPVQKEKSEYEMLIDDLRSNNNWHECYEKKWLFTRNEKPQYEKITEWAANRGYIVLGKVRMADLVSVRNDKKWSQALFRKVSQKHLDFVICKRNLDPVLAIEIQDNSHNNLKTMETDAFKKIVLESCGYKLLQVYDVTDEILDRAISS